LGIVRQRALLSLSLPVAVVGCLGGHAAGYALVGTSQEDARIHGYLGFAPQFLAVCAVFIAVSLALRVSGRLAGRPAAWPFGLLPPFAFLAQELLERLVAGLPAHSVFAPTVYAGLAAQLPIAMAAFFVARALLRVADAATRSLATRAPALIAPAAPLAAVGTPLLASKPLAFGRLARPPPPRL
jgi:hypothetical protein